MNIKKHIPNSITLLNMALGFIAILINDPFFSPILIFSAGVADLFDGMAARLLNVKSALGAQLDSLADLLSFGIAPAFLYYHHLLTGDLFSMIVSCIVVLLSAIRLAVFNIDDTQHSTFRGLPSPANGLFLAFLVFSFDQYPSWLNDYYLPIIIPLGVALFMILPIDMFSFKGWAGKTQAEKIWIGIFIAISMILFILFQWISIPLIVGIYIVFALLHKVIGKGEPSNPVLPG